jgi:hypothetical protein
MIIIFAPFSIAPWLQYVPLSNMEYILWILSVNYVYENFCYFENHEKT